MKIVSKLHQKSITNQWKWGPWGHPGATLGIFGVMLVESDEFWPHFGLIFFTFSLQDGYKMASRWDPGPFWAPSWGSKWSKIDPRSDPKRYPLDDRFEGWFLKRFGANLVPSWAPKTSQNGAKLGAKSILVWCWFESYFWKDFGISFCWILYTT